MICRGASLSYRSTLNDWEKSQSFFQHAKFCPQPNPSFCLSFLGRSTVFFWNYWDWEYWIWIQILECAMNFECIIQGSWESGTLLCHLQRPDSLGQLPHELPVSPQSCSWTCTSHYMKRCFIILCLALLPFYFQTCLTGNEKKTWQWNCKWRRL